jgi:SOS-response transcriptional repressor LexA
MSNVCPRCGQPEPITTRPMTPKMRAYLDVVAAFRKGMGHDPNYNQIALMLNVRSKSNINRLTNALIARGALQHSRFSKRALNILEQPNVC